MRIALIVLLSVSFAGCATCQKHPTACAIGASIVVSSVITTVAMHRAKNELEEEAAAAERGQQQPTTALRP